MSRVANPSGVRGVTGPMRNLSAFSVVLSLLLVNLPAMAQSSASPASKSSKTSVREGAEEVTRDARTPEAQAGSLSPRQIYDQTLRGVVMLLNGDKTCTGWILDKERRLVVTNQHCVEISESLDVLFPEFTEEGLIADTSHYAKQATVKAKVLDSSTPYDLAIIQVDSLPAESRELALAARSASPGDRVHAIGGLPQGSQGMWKYSTGYVSQVSKGSPSGHEIRVLQSNIDINRGNSGGPIVNDSGQVVGVVQSINLDARDVSYNVDVGQVRIYLDEVLPLLKGEEATQKVALGKRHLTEGRVENALRLFTQALDQDPEIVEAYTQRGWAFIELQDFVTALNDFKQATKRDQRHSDAWYGRARANRLLGEFDKALSDLSSGIAGNPENANLYNERAIVQEALGKNDLALADYQRALQIDPHNATVMDNRAELYVDLERYDDAIADSKRAIEENPRNAWYHNRMGVALHRAARYQEAVQKFLEASEILPEEAMFPANIGESLQAAGEHETALKAYSKAIELDASNWYYFYSRAWSLRRLEQFRDALTDLNQAISLNVEAADAYYERGLVWQSMGDAASANSDLDKAASLNPDRYNEKVAQAKTSQSNHTTSHEVARPHDVTGRWYVNQIVKGVRIEMTQNFYADGSYNAVVLRTENGNTKQVDEKGNFHLVGDEVEFHTNLGDYRMKYKFEDGMLWLLFNDLETWLGSVRQ